MTTHYDDHPTLIVVSEEKPWSFWCAYLGAEQQHIDYAISRIGNSVRSVDFFLELNRLKIIQKPKQNRNVL